MNTQQVINDLTKFETAVMDNGDIIYELKTSVVREIVRVRAIDTGRMISSINYSPVIRTSKRMRYKLDAVSQNSDVIYDDIVERGRRRPTPLEGRYPYKRGIEGADIHGTVDRIADSIFQKG